MDANRSTLPEQQSPPPEVGVSTKLLRERIREYTNSHREQLRANASDSLRFGVGEIKARIEELDNLTEKDVTGLAARIKRRKHATVEDMYRLSHAFLQDIKNIEAFNKVTGAIQVLIKELTGNDAERQLSAAECLCNLSLGESPVCEKIASLGGSYLVTYLHSNEAQLVRLCLWNLANILATGHKGAAVLMKMQLLPQLWKMYCDDDVAEPLSDYREDAAICLQLIALKADELLTTEDRNFILEHLSDKNVMCTAAEFHLQIIFLTLFSQRECIASLEPMDSLFLMNYSLNNINSTNAFVTPSQRLKVVFAVRILANLLAAQPSLYSTLQLQVSCVWSSNLISLLNKLFVFHNSHLTQEVLWLLKNILYLEKEYSLMKTDIVGKLHIFDENTPIIDSDEGTMDAEEG